MYDPLKDGIDHINIYSKGITELGRYLSNWANAPVVTDDGYFASIEGYWYWLSSHDEVLRNLYGFKAKQVGKQISITGAHILPADQFRLKIRDACWAKIHTNQKMLTAFIQSALPFTHYYAYGGKVVNAGHEWTTVMWEQYRTYIKNGYKI